MNSSRPAFEVHLTQSTAPVLDFRCLFTRDIQRKQKRWQDGRLKFHTFNKRVMVYDDRSNFVGDVHWRETGNFAEGEELQLERSGALVEVGEYVGTRDQDLTELVEKRIKEREERVVKKTADGTSARLPAITMSTTHLQPKTLNSVLSPTEKFGKAAVPIASQFKARQRLAYSNLGASENESPAKKRRPNACPMSKSAYAQNLMGATIALTSSRSASIKSIRYDAAITKPFIQKADEPVIDLTVDDQDEDEQQPTRTRNRRKILYSPEFSAKSLRPARLASELNRGYVSNLTGVTPTFSRPNDAAQARVSSFKPATVTLPSGSVEHPSFSVGLGASPECGDDRPASMKEENAPVPLRSPHGSDKAGSFSLSTINCSSLGISRPKNISVVPRQMKPKRPSPKRYLSRLISRESPSVDLPTSTVRHSKISCENNATNSSIVISTLGPTSALRIKPRPPRRMMFIERFKVYNTPGESLASKRLARARISKPKNDLVLSQATKQINVFCEKQDTAIQLHLNRNRPKPVCDDDFPPSPPVTDNHRTDELPRKSEPSTNIMYSSSIDNDLIHQSIDSLLIRQELQCRAAVYTPQESQKPKNSNRSFNRNIDIDSGTNESNLEVAFKHPALPGTISGPMDRPTRSPQDSQEQVTTRLESPEVRLVDPGPSTENQLPNNIDKTILTKVSLRAVASPCIALEKSSNYRVLQIPQQATYQQSQKSCQIGGISYPTNYSLNRILKQSACPEHDLELRTPGPFGISKLVEAHSGDADSCSKLSPGPWNDSRKLSPTPKTLLLPTEPDPDVFPRTSITSIVQAISRADTGPTITKAAAPRERLVNPATRGKSLQSLAASTDDTLNPACTTISVPPFRLLSQAERDFTHDSNSFDRPGEALKRNYSIGGPWSRESFDLFGNWKPNEKDI